MGKFRNRKRKNAAKEKKASQEPKEQVPYDKFVTVMENAAFEEYYKAQGFIPTEEEWELFMKTCRTPLGTSFRITGNRNHAQDLKEFMKRTYVDKIQGFEVEGELIQPPKPLSWYPDELAWEFHCGRTALRKSEGVAAFHKFLVSETEVGNITRQEVVSMIPVLLLDVEPGHWVMDMCAAPGSKTGQIVEALHADTTVASGVVLANDADAQRSQMLVHCVKRLQSPCLMVTNHEAQHFPNIYVQGQEGEKDRMIQFDRILCDVPCSGDGTIRKNKGVWQSWNRSSGLGLHKIQLQILERACQLVKVGGRIVYSTCSLNPMENEAVVAALLTKAAGSFRLVNVSDKLPGLKRMPGVHKWKVFTKGNVLVSNWEEVRRMDGKHGVHPTHFAPEDADKLGLEHCLRIFPHYQNSGGFFVAVLEKLDEYNPNASTTLPEASEEITEEVKVEAVEAPAEDEVAPVASQELAPSPSDDPSTEDRPSGMVGWTGKSESPFLFLEPDHEVVNTVCNLYGIHESFPRDLFVVRTDNEQSQYTSIYTVTREAKEILTAKNCRRLKLVNTGVKLFKRNGGDSFETCPYRVCSEGIQTITPILSADRQISIGLTDLIVALKSEYPHIRLFSESCQSALSSLQPGSCLLRFDPSSEAGYSASVREPIVIPFYRANVSVSLLVSRKERTSLIHRLTGEVVTSFEGITSQKKPRLDIEEQDSVANS